MTNEKDVAALEAHVLDKLGATHDSWPGGYPDDVELALLDAIFSVRARYGDRKKKTGVFGAVHRWSEYRGGSADDLRVLAAADLAELTVITNRSVLSGRPKAQVAIDAAVSLVAAGITTADAMRGDAAAAKRAYLSVRGCGPVTWAYVQMLVGIDDVKADVWVVRFVAQALGRDRVESATASTLVKAVAHGIGVQERQLDHAIWRYQRVLSDHEGTMGASR